MCVRRVPWHHGKAPIEVGSKFGQVGIGGRQVRNQMQAQFFRQAILQRLVHAFDTPFGLRGIGTDQGNVQFIQRPRELGHAVAGHRMGMIDPKDPEFIAIKRPRPSMLEHVAFGRLEITMRGFRTGEEQFQ